MGNSQKLKMFDDKYYLIETTEDILNICLFYPVQSVTADVTA
jgi:hypothetical protein